MTSEACSQRPVTAPVVLVPPCGHLAIDDELARDLMGSVKHHLRTPLTAVLGHAELLVDRGHDLPPGVQQSLACLLQAAERLEDVVGAVCDLIDVACVGPHVLDPVDVSALVAEEVALFQPRAVRREVRLLVSGEPGQHGRADSRRLRRALRELLDHALAGAPDRSAVRIASTASSTGIRIRVCGPGDGSDPDSAGPQARLGGRDASVPQPPAGWGVGLAVASAVAAWHGGRLVVADHGGRGVEACLELPATSRA